MSSMFRRIDHIADLIEDWNARNAYVSARSASSSGPVESAQQRLPHPFAVVAQRLRLADRPPEERPFVGVVDSSIARS